MDIVLSELVLGLIIFLLMHFNRGDLEAVSFIKACLIVVKFIKVIITIYIFLLNLEVMSKSIHILLHIRRADILADIDTVDNLLA